MQNKREMKEEGIGTDIRTGDFIGQIQRNLLDVRREKIVSQRDTTNRERTRYERIKAEKEADEERAECRIEKEQQEQPQQDLTLL